MAVDSVVQTGSKERIMDENEYDTYIYGYRVEVDKVGGGTLGRKYDGNWIVSVESGGTFLYDNEILHTETPKTHEEVAYLAADFASERGF
jgi:hypothetical protein